MEGKKRAASRLLDDSGDEGEPTTKGPEKKKRNRTGEKTAKTYVIGMINIAAFLGGTPVMFSEARQEQLLRHFLGPRMRLPDSWAKVGQGVVKAWGRYNPWVQAGRKIMEGLATADSENEDAGRTEWALHQLDDTPFQEEVVKWLKDYGHQRILPKPTFRELLRHFIPEDGYQRVMSRFIEEVHARVRDKPSLKGDRSYHTQTDLIRNIEVDVIKNCLIDEYKRAGTPLPPWVDNSECTLERMRIYLEERLQVKLKVPPFLQRHLQQQGLFLLSSGLQPPHMDPIHMAAAASHHQPFPSLNFMPNPFLVSQNGFNPVMNAYGLEMMRGLGMPGGMPEVMQVDPSAYLSHPSYHASFAALQQHQAAAAASLLRYPPPMFLPQMAPLTTFPSVVPTPPPMLPHICPPSSSPHPPSSSTPLQMLSTPIPSPPLMLTSTYPGPSIPHLPRRSESRGSGTPLQHLEQLGMAAAEASVEDAANEKEQQKEKEQQSSGGEGAEGGEEEGGDAEFEVASTLLQMGQEEGGQSSNAPSPAVAV